MPAPSCWAQFSQGRLSLGAADLSTDSHILLADPWGHLGLLVPGWLISSDSPQLPWDEKAEI